MKDPFALEIFTNPQTQEASGFLYIDDGESYNYNRSKEYNLFEFKFHSDFSLEVIPLHIGYHREEPFVIDAINIYGLNIAPPKIMLKVDEEYVEMKEDMMKYHSEKKKLMLRGTQIDLIKAEEGTQLYLVYETYQRRGEL